MPSLAAHFTMAANLQTKTTGIKEASFTVTVCSYGQIIFFLCLRYIVLCQDTVPSILLESADAKLVVRASS